MNDIDDIRERVAQACRVLGTLNLTKAATGHVSARLPGTERAFIRARGQDELGVRYTTPEEVIEIDLDGRAIGNPPGLVAPSIAAVNRFRQPIRVTLLKSDGLAVRPSVAPPPSTDGAWTGFR